MSRVCRMPHESLASPGRALPITSCQSSVVLVSYSQTGTCTSFLSYNSIASGRADSDEDFEHSTEPLKFEDSVATVAPATRASLSFNCPRPNRTEQPSQFKRPRVGTPIDAQCMSEHVSDDLEDDSETDSDFDLSSECSEAEELSDSSFGTDDVSSLVDEDVFGLAE